MNKGIKTHVLNPVSGTPDGEAAYKANPAEKQAYKYSEGFEAKIRSALSVSLGKKPYHYKMSNLLTQVGGSGVTREGIVSAVKKEKSLLITVADEVSGM